MKGSCIRCKINKVAEDVKHWGFASRELLDIKL